MFIALKHSITVAPQGAKCSPSFASIALLWSARGYPAASYKHLAPPEPKQLRQVS
jgi:hypothetical protein